MEWTLRTNKVGTYEVTLQAASPDPSQLNIVVGGKELTVKLTATGDFHKFALVTAGRLELTAGVATLTAKPVKNGWKPINLRSIELRPGKIGRLVQATPAAVTNQIAPALGALPIALAQRDQMLVSTRIRTDQHTQAAFSVPKPARNPA